MGKISVLIAEDNSDTRLMLNVLLESEGFEVVTAEDGAEALENLAHKRPDIILTDLMMPNVDGLELIRRVREQEEFADLPIVAMSAFGGDHLAKAYLTGATETIRKPFDSIGLVETLNRLLPDQAKTWH